MSTVPLSGTTPPQTAAAAWIFRRRCAPRCRCGHSAADYRKVANNRAAPVGLADIVQFDQLFTQRLDAAASCMVSSVSGPPDFSGPHIARYGPGFWWSGPAATHDPLPLRPQMDCRFRSLASAISARWPSVPDIWSNWPRSGTACPAQFRDVVHHPLQKVAVMVTITSPPLNRGASPPARQSSPRPDGCGSSRISTSAG